MSKYVDVENINPADYVETWDCTCSEFGTQTVMSVDDMRYLPGTDVAPVVHGKWEYKEEWGHLVTYTCSICGQTLTTMHGEFKFYCPNCGAKMDLEDGE